MIPEPSSLCASPDDLLQSSESPCVDLAAWLGSMPRLRSDSIELPTGGLGHDPLQGPDHGEQHDPEQRVHREERRGVEQETLEQEVDLEQERDLEELAAQLGLDSPPAASSASLQLNGTAGAVS